MNSSKKLSIIFLFSLMGLQAEAIASDIVAQIFTTAVNACAETMGELFCDIHIPISYASADGTAMLTKHVNLCGLCLTTAGATVGGISSSSLIKAIAEYKACDNQDKKAELRNKITLLASSLTLAIIGTGLCLHYIIHDNPVTSADII